MCGIVGVYNLQRQPLEPRVVAGMMALQQHRGPDDTGLRLFSLHEEANPPSVEIKNGVERLPAAFEGGLGFNRLSILDLSYDGHQPMANAEGTVIIAFNGEIYNAFDFKAELIAQGYSFRSHTDTEILLYLYERYGIAGMLQRINGMFAIVICDLTRKRIYLVRDRVGIKPLYYYVTPRMILFASEVKSFFAHPDFQPTLAEAHLDEYFLFRYCAGDRHLLKDVRSVPPATVLTISPDGLDLHAYWNFSDSEDHCQASRDDIAVQLESVLRSSVKRQLQSDVTLGCQLSGGIDSSLIAMMACEEAGAYLHAISIVLKDSRYSEETYIDHVCRRYQLECHKYLMDDQFFLDHLLAATWHLDQPLNHPNSLGIFLLAKQAKEWMTVLLSGEGADELLGGYPRYAYAYGQYRSAAALVSPLVGKLPRPLYSRFVTRFGRHPNLNPVDWFILSSAFLSPELLRQLRPAADPVAVVDVRRSLFDNTGSDFVKNCLKYDLKTYMVDLLIRQDKMTMAHSIENRVPFLDNAMLDLWGTVPSSCLVKPSILRERYATKVPLKQIAERYFGREFAYRKKMGFALPLQAFLGSQRFREIMEEIVLPGVRARGVFSYRVFDAWWRNLSSLSPMETESFWIFVAFELWAYLFLDGHWINGRQPSRNPEFAVG